MCFTQKICGSDSGFVYELSSSTPAIADSRHRSCMVRGEAAGCGLFFKVVMVQGERVESIIKSWICKTEVRFALNLAPELNFISRSRCMFWRVKNGFRPRRLQKISSSVGATRQKETCSQSLPRLLYIPTKRNCYQLGTGVCNDEVGDVYKGPWRGLLRLFSFSSEFFAGSNSHLICFENMLQLPLTLSFSLTLTLSFFFPRLWHKRPVTLTQKRLLPSRR